MNPLLQSVTSFIKEKKREFYPAAFLCVMLIGGLLIGARDLIFLIIVTGIFFLIGFYIQKRNVTHGKIHYILSWIFAALVFSDIFELTAIFGASGQSTLSDLTLLFLVILILSALFAIPYKNFFRRFRKSPKLKEPEAKPLKKTERDKVMFGRNIVKILAALLILSAIVLISLMFFSDGSPTSTSYALNVSIIAMISTLALAGFILLGWVLVLAVFRLFRSISRLAGESIAIRISSLGAVALITPDIIRYVMIEPFKLILKIVTQFITAVQSANLSYKLDYYQIHESAVNQVDFFSVINVAIDSILLPTWYILNQSVSQFFDYFPVQDFILGIALWVIVGQTLTFFFEEAPGAEDKKKKFPGFLADFKPATRQNFLLTLVFIASGYLSIAAMVAIPWLEEGGSEDTDRQNRVERLKQVTGTEESFNAMFPEYDDTLQDPLSGLNEAYFTSLVVTNAKLNDKWNELTKIVKEKRDELQKQRKDRLDSWNKLKSDAWSRIIESETMANAEFDRNSLDMGVRERKSYFQEIASWHRSNVRSYKNFLRETRSSIQTYEKNIEKWVSDSKASLQGDLEWINSPGLFKSRGASSQEAAPPEGSTGAETMDRSEINIWQRAEKYTPYNMNDPYEYYYFDFGGNLGSASSIPPPPQPGSQWGIFGLVAGWLLKTKSLSLILITGMLGFGLFGSVISSFVRDQQFRKPGEPLVKDLADAVVRGLSAAVVVFLAVEGGLAVITSGESQPNAYVLFFICLVGAVFSERVWWWARERLYEKFSTEDEAATEQVDSGQTGEEAAEEPADSDQPSQQNQQDQTNDPNRQT